uniref:Uncharacterized protein n=1 Tax=Anguilla anguilla TaxID=7936 RepID=A0A0E9WWB6_ANGAN
MEGATEITVTCHSDLGLEERQDLHKHAGVCSSPLSFGCSAGENKEEMRFFCFFCVCESSYTLFPTHIDSSSRPSDSDSHCWRTGM